MLPSDLPQLVILLTFVVPGFVYQVIRARFMGPSPEDLDQLTRILRAFAVSALFGLLYLAFLGDWMLQAARAEGPLVERPRLGALAAALAIFGIPAATALGFHLARVSEGSRDLRRRLAHDDEASRLDLASGRHRQLPRYRGRSRRPPRPPARTRLMRRACAAG
jgi:hypothetical protein